LKGPTNLAVSWKRLLEIIHFIIIPLVEKLLQISLLLTELKIKEREKHTVSNFMEIMGGHGFSSQ